MLACFCSAAAQQSCKQRAAAAAEHFKCIVPCNAAHSTAPIPVTWLGERSVISIVPYTMCFHSDGPWMQVILGARALLANGGIMSDVGSHVVALAAKRHAVPLVVLVGLYKLSPLFPHDPIVTFNDFKVPLSFRCTYLWCK